MYQYVVRIKQGADDGMGKSKFRMTVKLCVRDKQGVDDCEMKINKVLKRMDSESKIKHIHRRGICFLHSMRRV